MALTQARYESGFIVQECCDCALPFGVTSHFDKLRREDHKLFYCPAGHGQSYAEESDLEKERRKSRVLADQVRMEREQREKIERQLRRVEKGTCPKCNRNFVNLARHMESKHKC